MTSVKTETGPGSLYPYLEGIHLEGTQGEVLEKVNEPTQSSWFQSGQLLTQMFKRDELVKGREEIVSLSGKVVPGVKKKKWKVKAALGGGALGLGLFLTVMMISLGDSYAAWARKDLRYHAKETYYYDAIAVEAEAQGWVRAPKHAGTANFPFLSDRNYYKNNLYKEKRTSAQIKELEKEILRQNGGTLPTNGASPDSRAGIAYQLVHNVLKKWSEDGLAGDVKSFWEMGEYAEIDYVTSAAGGKLYTIGDWYSIPLPATGSIQAARMLGKILAAEALLKGNDLQAEEILMKNIASGAAFERFERLDLSIGGEVVKDNLLALQGLYQINGRTDKVMAIERVFKDALYAEARNKALREAVIAQGDLDKTIDYILQMKASKSIKYELLGGFLYTHFFNLSGTATPAQVARWKEKLSKDLVSQEVDKEILDLYLNPTQLMYPKSYRLVRIWESMMFDGYGGGLGENNLRWKLPWYKRDR